MTREEQARRREDIKEQFANGISPDDLVKMYGLTKSYIYQIVGFKRETKIDVLRNDVDIIIQRLKGGETKASIAKSYGVDRSSIITVLKESGITCFAVQRNSEEDAARRIFDKTGGRFEYVSGYTNKEGNVLIRCTVCGGEFERTYHHLTTAPNPYGCPLCAEKRAEVLARQKAEERAARELEREKRRIQAEARRVERERKKKESLHPCAVCGEITARPKYCSDDCLHHAMNARHEYKRRIKIKSAYVDKGISVKSLFKRDKGVCHICGKECNLEDYIIRDGAFIAGDWYPSVDHVVALSKGGLHSWANVKLAHRLCNTIKGADGLQ